MKRISIQKLRRLTSYCNALAASSFSEERLPFLIVIHVCTRMYSPITGKGCLPGMSPEAGKPMVYSFTPVWGLHCYGEPAEVGEPVTV